MECVMVPIALEAGFTQGAEETPEWCYPSSMLYRICTGGSPCARNIALAGCQYSTSLSSVVEPVVPTHREQACRLEHGPGCCTSPEIVLAPIGS